MGDFLTCREKILSEDYYDLITDYLFTEEFREADSPDYCYTKVDDKYGLVYVKKDEVPAMNVATFGYSLIPKVYGLMQDFSQIPLIESGITRVQNQPLLLTGSGVILAFIDTGERVKKMSKNQNNFMKKSYFSEKVEKNRKKSKKEEKPFDRMVRTTDNKIKRFV